MTRSRVFTVRSRSDQNRAIGSREHNGAARNRAQYGKETELFELMWRLLHANVTVTLRERGARPSTNVVMLPPTVGCESLFLAEWST